MEKQMIKYFKENINYKNKDQMYNVNKKILKGDKKDLVTQLLFKYYDLLSTNEGTLYENRINELQSRYNELDGRHVDMCVEKDYLENENLKLKNQIEILKQEITYYAEKTKYEDDTKKRLKQQQKKYTNLVYEFDDFKREMSRLTKQLVDLKARERPETEKDNEIKRLRQQLEQQQKYYSEALEIQQQDLVKQYERESRK